MIKNIPNKYNQDSLMAEINTKGHQAKYDFFYIPIDLSVIDCMDVRLIRTKDMGLSILKMSNISNHSIKIIMIDDGILKKY